MCSVSLQCSSLPISHCTFSFSNFPGHHRPSVASLISIAGTLRLPVREHRTNNPVPSPGRQRPLPLPRRPHRILKTPLPQSAPTTFIESICRRIAAPHTISECARARRPSRRARTQASSSCPCWRPELRGRQSRQQHEFRPQTSTAAIRLVTKCGESSRAESNRSFVRWR